MGSCTLNARCGYPCEGSRAKHVLLLLVVLTGAFSLIGCTKKVIVPSVVQQDVEQAKNTLAAVPLKAGQISGIQGSVPAGAYVVSQTPSAGQQVPANSAVDLVVEAPVSVPNLTGSNLTDAVTILQGIGLKVALVKQPTANIFRRAKVLQQDLPPNSLVHRDAVVTLTVATPPDVSVLLGAVTKSPSYEKLNPEYRKVLDQFLK